MKNIALAQFVAILILTTFICVLSVKLDTTQQYIRYLEMKENVTSVCFGDEWHVDPQKAKDIALCVTKDVTLIEVEGTTTLYDIYKN